MTKYAAIQGNIVQNIIEADSLEVAEAVTGLTCVEYTDDNSAVIGLSYDGTTFEQHIISVIEEPTE